MKVRPHTHVKLGCAGDNLNCTKKDFENLKRRGTGLAVDCVFLKTGDASKGQPVTADFFKAVPSKRKPYKFTKEDKKITDVHFRSRGSVTRKVVGILFADE